MVTVKVKIILEITDLDQLICADTRSSIRLGQIHQVLQTPTPVPVPAQGWLFYIRLQRCLICEAELHRTSAH